MRFNIIFVNRFVILCFIYCLAYGQNMTNICTRLNKQTKWSCKKVSECPYANILNLRKQNIPCNDDEVTKKICCPEPRTHRKPLTKRTTVNETTIKPAPYAKEIAWEKCQEYSKYRFINETIESQIDGEPPIFIQIRDCKEIEPLIVGGVEAGEKEFPHMALIGFGDQISHITWVCGGSLISEQYILSAAHCTNNGTKNEVNWALLGTLSKYDATMDKLNKSLFSIVKRIHHPNYHPPLENNDIALYRLQAPLTLSPSIRPICLYISDKLPTDNDMKALVIGWGRTDAAEDTSDTLLKVTINLLSNELCRSTYQSEVKFKDGFDSKSMICAGDVNDAKDTCQGDSGGPLQVPVGPDYECLWKQIGITSVGSAFCGTNTPSIYTKVSDYLPWIQSIVWPS